jgi:site-specific DNA-methyltransferase (adenine-specific)
VHQGDSFDFLRYLGPECIHAIVEDPPYASGGFREAERQGAKVQGIDDDAGTYARLGWFVGDNMTTGGLVFLLRSRAFEAARVLVDGGSLLTFCDWRMTWILGPALESAGLRWQAMVCWDKGSAGLGKGFRGRAEYVLHHVKGVGRFHADDGENVIRCGRVRPEEREHPTEKPVELLRQLIRVVAPVGGLVFDGFAGSGSTGCAAILEGRRFLGVERNPGHVETIRARLSGIVPERDGQLGLLG